MICKNTKPERVLIIFLCLTTLSVFVTSITPYTCETPDSWLSGNSQIQQTGAVRALVENGTTWPNGTVKYKLHSSLTWRDIYEVQKAFEEYHRKTCVRFEPWEEGDIDFVSIEVDNIICGFANVCKIGGAQVAKFGKHCRNMATMIHELGHTLCLGHEHQRQDRDVYLNFSSCESFPRKVEPMRRPQGIYDYASQMHSQCGSCTGGWPKEGDLVCGRDEGNTPGLSVLDVDNLNYLYNCQGCQRHRWVPASLISLDDFPKMYTYGYETNNGEPLYACRVLFHTEVVAGMYNPSKKSCKITRYSRPHEIEENVEVLTIPGGLVGNDCSVYKLVNQPLVSVDSMIPVGSLVKISVGRNWTSFVAYSTYNNGSAGKEKLVGKVWYKGENGFYAVAEFARNAVSWQSAEYQVLTCDFDTNCMIKHVFTYSKGQSCISEISPEHIHSVTS